jgi:hypothetical protein
MMNSNLESLLSNLEQYADVFDRIYNRGELKYCSTQRLILDLGIHFKTKIESPLSGKRNECYKNCFQNLVLPHSANSNLYYCEGFAAHEGIGLVVAHAWLVNDRGEVIDPTWRDPQSFINPVYLGVVFDWEFVMAVAAKTEMYGVLDNDRATEYEFKRLGLPPNALHPKFHNTQQSQSLAKPAPSAIDTF